MPGRVGPVVRATARNRSGRPVPRCVDCGASAAHPWALCVSCMDADPLLAGWATDPPWVPHGR
jgi:hypothetical protein